MIEEIHQIMTMFVTLSSQVHPSLYLFLDCFQGNYRCGGSCCAFLTRFSFHVICDLRISHYIEGKINVVLHENVGYYTWFGAPGAFHTLFTQ